MYSYSKAKDATDLTIEYWVRSQDGSLVRRFNGGALYSAREEAQQAQGRVFEMLLDKQAGDDVIVTELEI